MIVATPAGGGKDPLQPSFQAGFTTCTTPDLTVGAVEYREGHYLYTRKFPGIPTMADISISRGVAKKDTAFFLWVKSAIQGANEYRVDLDISHFHKSDYAGLPVTDGTIDSLKDPGDVKASRIYHVYNAIPQHVKIATDLDANAAEVSIAQVDIAYEYFDIEDTTP